MRRVTFNLLAVMSAAIFAASVAHAGDTTSANSTTAAVTEAPDEFKNWIELGLGGVITRGDTAQFEQEHRLSGDQVYGGIQDLHYEHSLPNDFALTVDGHALWDINDYNLRVDLSKPKLGYLRFGYDEFRSWYDGNGGFFPPHGGAWFPPPIPEMHIDRGDAWVELGLRVPDWPEITFHYEHQFRDGQKDSTIWGDTTLTGIQPPQTNGKKIAPAYRDIDETRDIFALEIDKTFGNTDVSLGMRYEHSEIDNRLQLERGAGQVPVITPGPPVSITGAQRFITNNDKIDNDIYNGHAITVTRFSDSLWFTGAYSYSTLGSDLSGTRIIGTHYNSMFGEPIMTLQSNDHGVLNLAGASEVEEHLFNANLFWVPLKDLNVIVGFRYTHEDKESDSMFLDTNTAANVAPFTASNPRGGFHLVAPLPKAADTFDRLNNFAERLELRYTHIQNWLFYAEGEWEEEFGDVHEHEFGGALVRGVPTPFDQGAMNKDTNLLGQKYTVGATWYPMTRLNLATQYFYKAASYDADFHSELATPTDVPTPLGAERNQRLLGQDWGTNDFNIRVTVRPKIPAMLGTISFVSRYDFMLSTANGRWGVSPAGPPPVVVPPPPAIPTGTVLNEEHTGTISKHVISEAMNWNPMARLYLQANFSLALDQTKSAAAGRILIPNTTPTLIAARNDYWTVTAGGGYIIDDKTDIRADYSFYRANDYYNNAKVAMPYGAGQTEHTVSATATRQITKNMRLLVRYCYFTYKDQTSGFHNDYEAHSIYSGLQIRF